MDITILTMPTGLMQPVRHLNAKLKFAILTIYFLIKMIVAPLCEQTVQ